MKDDIDVTHVVIHALNQWLYETWQFDYAGRIFTTPIITLPIVERAIEELEWVVARGARVVLIRPALVPGLRGPRSFALPEFDPFWEKVVEHDVLVAMHSSDSGYEAYANEWMGSTGEMLPFQPQAFRMVTRGGRSRTRSPLHLSRRPFPFPAAQGRGDRERQQLAAPLLKSLADIYKKMPQDFQEDPVDVFKRQIHVSPFWEDDLGALAQLSARARPVRL